jgi:hypothetical protein
MPVRRPYRPRHAYETGDDTGVGGARFVAALLALAVAALVVVHALWQVTSAGPAERILRSVLPPLTDLDQTLAANLDSLRELTGGQPPDGRVTVPGLPIPVQVTREEAESDPAALRAVVLQRMAEAIYQRGTDAFQAEGGRTPAPTILSSQWALQQALNFLTKERHDSLAVPWLALIVTTVVLAGLAVWLFEGPARLSGPGISVITGSIIGAVVALLIRGSAIAFYGEDEVADSIVRLVARDTSMTMLVVALTFLAFGIIVTIVGALARRWDQAQPGAPAPVGRGTPWSTGGRGDE